MKQRLSDASIRAAKAGQKPYEIWDSSQPGLVLRVQPSGNKSFVLQWARGKRLTIGDARVLTLAFARQRTSEGLREAAAGNSPRRLDRPAVGSLQDFLDNHYAPWARAHRRTAEGTLGILQSQFKDYMPRPLADLSVGQLEEYRTRALKRGKSSGAPLSPKSVNNYCQILKSVLSKAVEWDMLERNPLAKLKPLKRDRRGVVRFLSPDEEKSLRAALVERDNELRGARDRFNGWRQVRHLDPLPEIPANGFGDHLAPMALTALNTGLRYGELASLAWRSVNFRGKTITVEAAHAKSGQTRHVPLNAECADILQRWRRQSGEFGLVFKGAAGARIGSVRKAWRNVLAKAKIEAFRWHDLRHTFASKLAMAGVDLNTIRELLGHGDLEMTLRYAHLAPDHKAAAVEKLSSLPGSSGAT